MKGTDHQVSTGSDQTQGLFREVAGGAGVPVLGRKARLLRYLHQPRSRDPRALGLRKQVGHAAHVAIARRHLSTLHHPYGTEVQAAFSLYPSRLCQARECRSR